MNENRRFFDDDFWRACKTDFDKIMAYRKSIKGKPTDLERAQLTLNKAFVRLYRLIGVDA